MTLKLLADALTFFTKEFSGVDYADTGFKSIFNKVFSGQRKTPDAIRLFFLLLNFAKINSGLQFDSKTLKSMFIGVVIRHPYTSLENFVSFWFVYQCSVTQVNFDSDLVLTSSQHVELWDIYMDVMYSITDQELTVRDLFVKIVFHILQLRPESRDHAYQNVKSCFTPLTEDSDLFESTYNEVAINFQF